MVSSDCQSHSIEQVLSSIRQWLQADRIGLYLTDYQTYEESVATEYKASQNFSVTDFNLIAEYGEQYQQGKPIVTEDLSQNDLPSAVVQQLKQLLTQAWSIVPIKKGDLLLGILAIQFPQTFPQDRLSANRLFDLANLITVAIEQQLTTNN